VTWPSTEADVPVANVQPVGGELHYSEGVHIGHRAWLRSGVAPAYPFGHGRGYTDWRLSNLRTAPEVRTGDEIAVALDVENIGDRSGKTVVQVYLERVDPSPVDRPLRWLAGHQAVRAEAGERTRISVSVDWRRFANWADGWSLEPGAFRLRVGFSVSDLPIEADVVVIETNH
jgi:beta-glucosidase